MAQNLIVDARGLHAWYGSSHVLHGVTLRIERGETVGLLGRNGMGKSTLIRTLLGHVAQRDGHIKLFGKDASRFKPHEVARLGVAYVPEGRGVFPNLPVRQWVLSVPKRLRYFMQRDGAVLNMVLRIFLRVIAQSLQSHSPGAAQVDIPGRDFWRAETSFSPGQRHR